MIVLLPPLVEVELEVMVAKLVIRRVGEDEVEYCLISVSAAAGMWIVRGEEAESEPEDMERSCRW